MAEYEADASSPHEARTVIADHEDRMTALRWAVVARESVTLIDLNRNKLLLRGVGFAHEDIIAFLKELGAYVTSAEIAAIEPEDSRKYALVSRHPWGEDRVM